MTNKYLYHVALFSIFIGIAMFWLCTRTIASTIDTNEQRLIEGNKAFALDLYANMLSTRENIFFSPYSVSSALVMTYAGARGRTETQMAEVLHINLEQNLLHTSYARIQSKLKNIQQKGKVDLSAVNALWFQKEYRLSKHYTDQMKNTYGAQLYHVDFKTAREDACKQINEWVQRETKNKISDLVRPDTLKPNTRLILTNAIYFKGKWMHLFMERLTKKEAFWLTANDKVDAPLMLQLNDFGYMENDNIQALELPYIGNDFSMIVLLPKKVDGLSELEKSLSINNLSIWMSQFRRTNVRVYLPKFKATYEMKMGNMLTSMGMTDAFSPDAADFSGIDGTKMLFLSEVVHKAFIDVNEEGTEAAAVTAVHAMVTDSIPPPPKEFRADHPFVFLIWDNNTGSILFMGRIKNPQSEIRTY